MTIAAFKPSRGLPHTVYPWAVATDHALMSPQPKRPSLVFGLEGTRFGARPSKFPAGLPLHAGWLHPALACLRSLRAVSSLQKFQFGFMTISLDTLGLVITLDEQPVVGHNVVHHDRRELHRVGAIPSAHDFCQDSVCVDWHRTGLDATSERYVGRHFRPIPGSVDDVEHLVASGQRAESRKRHANTRQSAGDEKGLAPSFLNRLHPFRIIPRVDLARARDVNSIGIVFVNFGNQRTVRA